MQQSEITRKVTFEEYLQIEEENNWRYEFYDGFLKAREEASLNHAIISGN